MDIVELKANDKYTRIHLTESVEDVPVLPEYMIIEGGIPKYLEYLFFTESSIDNLIRECELYEDTNAEIIREYLSETDYKTLRAKAPGFVYKSGETLRQRSAKTNKGSYLVNVDKEGTIIYRTPSYTKDKIVYMQLVKLVDLPTIYMEHKDSKPIDQIIKMAIFGDILVHCTDPSWVYWGFKYIGTVDDYAVYPENRPPDINNPGKRGSVCKHLDNVLYTIPFNVAQIGKKMKDNGFLDIIERMSRDKSGDPPPSGEIKNIDDNQ